MTKEEVKEMINSTINTNGSGAITGESLNLALQAIVETMGTGNGGAVWEKISGTVSFETIESITVTTTDEDKAANVALIERSKQNIINGVPVMAYMAVFNEGQNTQLWPPGRLFLSPQIYVIYALPFIISIQEDGSVTIQVGG